MPNSAPLLNVFFLTFFFHDTFSTQIFTLFLHFSLFFFNDTATTEIYTLSLHDALPISRAARRARAALPPGASPPGASPRAAAPRAALGSRSRALPLRPARSSIASLPSLLLPAALPFLFLTMPIPGDVVAVLRRLIRGELPHDGGVHLDPDGVEAGPHRVPHRVHPGPVLLQDRRERIVLGRREPQLLRQRREHPIGTVARARGRLRAAGPPPPAARPAGGPRDEGRGQEDHRPCP